MAVVSPNERQILASIWNHENLTRAALTARMEITQQSVHRLLSTLQTDGLVLFGPLVPPSYKGKPSPSLLLNPRFACTIGVSIDTDAAGVACMDFAGGHISRRIRIAELSVIEVLDRIDAVVDELLEISRFTRDDVLGIGFAISGFVVEGTRYNPPDPLAEWASIELGPYVADHFGIATWTENTANAAALAEAMFGAGRAYSDFIYLSFNYGLGAGVIVGGELLRGGHGNAGELSGMFTEDEAENRPALRSLVDMLREQGGTVRTIEDLTEACDPIVPAVTSWLDRVTPHHNRIVNVLASTVDPQAIVFGGQIPAKLADALIARTRFYSKPRHGIVRKMPNLVVSRLGTESAAIGAACLPLKSAVF